MKNLPILAAVVIATAAAASFFVVKYAPFGYNPGGSESYTNQDGDLIDQMPDGTDNTQNPEEQNEPEEQTPPKISVSSLNNTVALIPSAGGGGGGGSAQWYVPNPFLPDPSVSLFTNPPPQPLDYLTVYVFNTGKDSYYIDTEVDDALNDAGSQPDGTMILQLLNQMGKTEVDLLITSHHSDEHIGGFIPVMDALPVTWVLDSGSGGTGPTYQDYISRASAKNLTIVTRGQTYQLSPNVSVEILNPANLSVQEKDNSIVFRLVFGSFRMLFTGDCAAQCQQDLLDSGLDISADVLKLPDHGSAVTSSAFLDAVNPTSVIISVSGEVTDTQGAPDPGLLADIGSRSAVIYRTDLNGNIVVTTNGVSYQVLKEI